MKKNSGFTLIEVIVTLVIVGIMAAIAGMGITEGVRGYIFAKDNTEISTKAQLAMARMNLIFMEFIDIVAATQASATYDLLVEGVSTRETLYFDSSDNTIKIAPGSNTSGGDILVDNVGSLMLTYWQGNTSWISGTHDTQLLSAIDMELELTRTDAGGNVTFATSVNPRNNENLGGEPTPTIDPGSGNGCFVATAAFGKADHPTVLVLRKFRDHYLSKSSVGRMLIDVYYSAGPYLADMIRDKPLPSALVRGLLLPLAGFAYLFVHFPYAWPVFIVLMLLALLSLKIFINKDKKRISTITLNQKGSVLIGAIAALVIFSTLGVAVVSMNTGSTFSQLGADRGMKAYYLAEAGVRYIASEFRHEPDEVSQDNRLLALHGEAFTLGGDGSFSLEVFPWYFRTTSVPSGSALQAQFPGGVPSDMTIPANGHLRIRNESTQTLSSALQYSSYSLSGNSINFTMAANLPSGYSQGSNLLPVGRANQSSLSRNGDLNLASGSGGVFPPIRGTFEIEGDNNEYSYERRVGDQLRNVRRTADPGEAFTLTGLSNAFVTSLNYLEVDSTGIYDQTERTVSYSIAIGRAPGGGQDAEFIDTFENLQHWAVGTAGQVGSHAVATIDNNKALAVTGYESIYVGGIWTYARASLLTLNWTTTQANLDQSWKLNDYLLSYDAQVKIRASGQDYYMPGIVFRVDGSGQMYGVSYLRANMGTTLGFERDYIPDDLCPQVDNCGWGHCRQPPMIVLWQETGSGMKWLAYKILSSADGVVDTNGRLVDWSTLLVRVIEADALQFTSGTAEFKHGEKVVGASSGAEAVVKGTPILTGGSWAGNNAAGWLTVTNVSKDGGTIQFQGSESLQVDGVTRAQYTGTSREKDNYIRVYYGRTADQGTANDNPLDNNRYGNPRITSGQGVNWPVKDVSDWAPDNDHFTLVQWNNDMQLDSGDVRLGTGSELNAIIRTSTLSTPDSGTFTRSEIGLDTWGSSSTSVYFDDFGLTTPAPGMRRGDLRPAFQQIQ